MCVDYGTSSISGTAIRYGSSTKALAEYTDINTHAAAYFSGQLGPSRSTTTYTPYIYSLSTRASHNTTVTYTISRTSSNTSAFKTTAEIIFSTPFLFFPAAGKTGRFPLTIKFYRRVIKQEDIPCTMRGHRLIYDPLQSLPDRLMSGLYPPVCRPRPPQTSRVPFTLRTLVPHTSRNTSQQHRNQHL